MAYVDKKNPQSWARPGIRSSDAMIIAARDPREWNFLRCEKLGIEIDRKRSAQRQMLMDVGKILDPYISQQAAIRIQLKRIGLQGADVTYQKIIQHPVDPLYYATLDVAFHGAGELEWLCEGKFHSGDRTIDGLAEYYGPQLNHQMLTSGFQTMDFAALFGHRCQFRVAEVERDDAWLMNYGVWVQEFVHYVATDQLPADMRSGEAAPKEGPKVAVGKQYSWTSKDNHATALGRTIVENHPKVALLEEAKDDFKAIVPKDATTVIWTDDDGGQVRVRRDKKGTLTLSVGRVPAPGKLLEEAEG